MLCDVSGCKVHSTEISFQNAIFYTGHEGDLERYRREELLIQSVGIHGRYQFQCHKGGEIWLKTRSRSCSL